MHINFFASLRSDNHMILLVLLLGPGWAYFSDLKRRHNMGWGALRSVLDCALNKYDHSGGSATKHTKFKYRTSFCYRQEPNELSVMPGYYIMSQRDDYVCSESLMRDKESLNKQGTELERGEHNWRRDVAHFQNMLAIIINNDVIMVDGVFSNTEEVEEERGASLKKYADDIPFLYPSMADVC